MGGLALKHLGVERLTADKYWSKTSRVQHCFKLLFGPDVHFAFVPSYSSKETFGDADALICSAELTKDWREKLTSYFDSRGYVKNGPVTSMEIENFQFS